MEEKQTQENSLNEDLQRSFDDTLEDVEVMVKKRGKTLVEVMVRHGYKKLDELWQLRKVKLKEKVKEGLQDGKKDEG